MRLLQLPKAPAAKLTRMAEALQTICRTAEACAAAAGCPGEEALMSALELSTGVLFRLYPSGGAQQQPLLEGLWQQLSRWLEAELLASAEQWEEQQRAALAAGLLQALEAVAAAEAQQQQQQQQQQPDKGRQERCLAVLDAAMQAWPAALAGQAGAAFSAACQLLPLCLRQQQGGRQLLLEAGAHYLRQLGVQSKRALRASVAAVDGAMVRYALATLAGALQRHVLEALLQEERAVAQQEAADGVARFGQLWEEVFGETLPRFA